MYYVYVIYSSSYNNYYTGSTENLENRLKEHNSGKCKYTSGRMPWRLIYKEEHPTRSEAMKREKFLKSGQGRKLLKDILSNSSKESGPPGAVIMER
jgi:putative endonuclease